MTSASSSTPRTSGVPALDERVEEWLTVPEVAELLGTAASNVRGALSSRRIVGVRPDGQHGVRVPAAFLVPAHLANAADPGPAPEPGQEKVVILPSLQGTITLLGDMGFSDEEILGWLFTLDDSLGETPLAALRAGRKSAVRRAAQLLV